MELLVEKYRPKVREDIVGNVETINRIFSMVNSGKLTHMAFEGIAGTGKTSTAGVIARQLFGTSIRSNYMELNSSDERGIDVVRDKIKTFAKISPFNSTFKVILLDESDEMTPESQNALRRIMEKYADITIFIFCVNSIEKLISPIKSRCEVFHFGPISTEDICSRLQVVYMKEKGPVVNGTVGPDIGLALKKIAEYAQGDMRKALNHLQVLLSSGEPLTEVSVDTIRPIDYGKLIFDSLQSGRFLEARTYYLKFLEIGFDSRNIISMLHKIYIVSEIELEEMKTAIISISEADYRMTCGVDKILALDALLLKLLKR